MKKTISIFWVIFGFILLLSGIAFGKVIATLSEVMNPEFIISDKEKLYVSEGTSVYIYSLKDFKLIKKFGKKGEGPKEFMGKVQRIVPAKDYILINSQGKISFYSKDGKYIKEKKAGGGMSIGNYFPLKTGFVGASLTNIENKLYSTISLFDENLEKGKVIAKFLSGSSGKMDVFGMVRAMLFYVYKNRIYALNEKGGVNIHDDSGKILGNISLNTDKVKFSKANEKEIRKMMKKEMPAGQYEAIKHIFTFPEYFPELLTIMVSNDTVYLLTFKRKMGKYETYIYDQKGKLIKKTFIQFKLKNGIQPYPFFINNGNAYQLIENDDTEDWELHENEF